MSTQPLPISNEQYWTIQQVMDRLHVSEPTVRRWLGNGSLLKTKAGDRTLVSETNLQDFLRRSTEKDSKKPVASAA